MVTEVASDPHPQLLIRGYKGDRGRRPSPKPFKDFWHSPDVKTKRNPNRPAMIQNITVSIKNKGTADATNVIIDLRTRRKGQPNSAKSSIGIAFIPRIPAGKRVTVPVTAEYNWRNYLLFVKAFDTYSMTHFSERTASWKPQENPQAAWQFQGSFDASD